MTASPTATERGTAVQLTDLRRVYSGVAALDAQVLQLAGRDEVRAGDRLGRELVVRVVSDCVHQLENLDGCR